MESTVTFFDFAVSYWWLVFPLGWFIGSGWTSWMKYQRHKANLDLLKSYAASGKEPPANLVAALDRNSAAAEEEDGGAYGNKSAESGASPFLVILFVGFAAIFAYAGKTGMLGLGEEGYFIAMIMIVLALAFLGAALFPRRNKDR